jgi:hypothetical protein
MGAGPLVSGDLFSGPQFDREVIILGARDIVAWIDRAACWAIQRRGLSSLRERDVTLSADQGDVAAGSRWTTSSAARSHTGEPCLHP